MGTAFPLDAQLRVADAPCFSKAELVIGSFAGFLQVIGRLRWHPTRVSCRVDLALGGFAPFDVLRASVKNNNQIPNRPDESIPGSIPEALQLPPAQDNGV